MKENKDKEINKDIVDNSQPDLEVSQVFLILFKNSSFYDFLEVLEELGDYYTICKKVKSKSGKISYKEYAIVNTTIKLEDMKKSFDNIKKDKEEIAIVGITLDMMENFEDEDMRNWCLQRQIQNMREILNQSENSGIKNIDDMFDKIELELKKIKENNDDKKDENT